MLAATAVFVGVWAASAPANWYASFPGAGHHWLPMLGAYNEHLSRDVGALYLALAVLSIGAALRAADDFLIRLTGLAWLVFSIPHLIYHLGHLNHFAAADKAGNAISLSVTVVLAAALMLPRRSTVAG